LSIQARGCAAKGVNLSVHCFVIKKTVSFNIPAFNFKEYAKLFYLHKILTDIKRFAKIKPQQGQNPKRLAP